MLGSSGLEQTTAKTVEDDHSHHWHTILTSPGAWSLYGALVLAVIGPAFMAWYKRRLRRRHGKNPQGKRQ